MTWVFSTFVVPRKVFAPFNTTVPIPAPPLAFQKSTPLAPVIGAFTAKVVPPAVPKSPPLLPRMIVPPPLALIVPPVVD